MEKIINSQKSSAIVKHALLICNVRKIALLTE